MDKKTFDLGVFAEKLGLYVVGILAAAIAFVLSAISLLHTTAVDVIREGEGLYTVVYDIKEKLESVIYYNDNLLLNLVVLAATLLICFVVVQRAKPVKTRWLGLFIFLWTFALGTIWVLSSQTAPSEDSGTVTSASWSFAEGNYSALQDMRYFKNYSFQLGYVLFNELIIRFLQTFKHLDNLMPLEVLNAAFLGVINLFLVLICDKLFKDRRITLLTTILLALSAAPIISCSFVYGIYPGMMFAVIALYCEIRYLTEDKLRFAWLAALSITLAVMAKSNYLIWLIAMVLIALVKMWKRKQYLYDLSFLAVTLALALSIQSLVIGHYEKVSGTDLGDAIPYTSWIAMGLNESDLAPGWYNYYFTLSNFEQSDFNADVAGEKSMEEIKNRLKYFAQNPQYANDFFYLKIASQWNDTAYQSIWNNVVRYQYKEKGALAAWVCGSGAGTVKQLMDFFAQLVFFAFCVGCVYLLKRKEFMLTPLPIVFLGGFFYQLISEGKSQYIMPYFIVMTGFAAFGIVCLCDTLREKVSPESRLAQILAPANASAAPETAAAEEERAAETAAEAEAAPKPEADSTPESKTQKKPAKASGKKEKKHGKS